MKCPKCDVGDWVLKGTGELEGKDLDIHQCSRCLSTNIPISPTIGVNLKGFEIEIIANTNSPIVIFKRNTTQSYSGVTYNPGEYYLNWLSDLCEEYETEENNPTHWRLPVLGLLVACFAIEGYTSKVGSNTINGWNTFYREHPPIKNSLSKFTIQMLSLAPQVCGNRFL